MKKQVLTSIALALTVTFAGCGGGSDSSSPNTPPTTPPPSGSTLPPGAAKVAGPLDALQTPVSQEVIAPLTSSFAGTPLAGVTACVDQIVVGDVVDTLDVLAIAIQNGAGGADPQAALTAAAAGVQAQIENIVIDLQGMLGGLNGSATSCLGNIAPTGGNPLAGTPLAPFGAALAPVLDSVYDQLHGTTGSTRPSLSLSQLHGILAQLEVGLDQAYAQIPSNVSTAPVVGAALSTVRSAVTNVRLTVIAASAQDVEATQAAIGTTLDSLLTGVLLGVVPVTMIETQGGQAGTLSTPINQAIDTVSGTVAEGLGTVLSSVLQQDITAALTPVTGALENSVLGAILGPLFDLLGDAGTSTSNPLGPVTAVLDQFFGGLTPAGNPLDLVLDLVTGGNNCVLAGTPLEFLCGN